MSSEGVEVKPVMNPQLQATHKLEQSPSLEPSVDLSNRAPLAPSVFSPNGQMRQICCSASFWELLFTGKSVIGEQGEIVVTKPIPNLPNGLWNDKDGSLYREKYFSKYPGIFTIGDCGMIDPETKNWIICCRSDEVLNPKGCRFGPSEIYNIVEMLPEVLDCLCVPQYGKDMDERVVLFLKIRDGYSFNEDLASKARKSIQRFCSFRHVPEVILEVKDIPYSLTGKRTEVIVKKIINNIPHSIVTVRNPESLQYYYNIPELEGFYE
ncbi:acetoacetyl-CoA synthetase [Trichonephila clavipes]|nr:acetoacetyl-CoA synthetase [Trichonephila clavipes]